MNPGQSFYLTLERTKMNQWPRKRRLKFRKRWRKQHNGQQFKWFLVVPRYAFKPLEPYQETMIFHLREKKVLTAR